MSDAPPKTGCSRKRIVDVNGIVVTRNAGKGMYVGVLDGPGYFGGIANAEIHVY